MAKKVNGTPTLRRYAQQFASMGGKARAAKYDAATLSEWAKKGGRPRTKKGKRHAN
jgi:hypothetical protein